ncbi:MAG: alpha/beta hydrolase [Oscillospiraceae bacterium]|nr:alpha/beta hydrolase [Oscillospiraceae bacterium]
MKVIEYGTANSEIIMLLHGGGLSWWNYQKEAELLSTHYHVVLPILDGHADSTDDFCSIEQNAEKIISYIDTHFNGSVKLLGGLSLGAQTALDLLSRRPNICEYAVIESAAVIPDRLIACLVGPIFSACYGLIQKKWFARLQFNYLRIRQELFDRYYEDSCKISKNNLLSFVKASALYEAKPSPCDLGAKLLLLVGSKEAKRIKKSAQLLKATIPNSTLQIKEGLYHGQFSLNCAEQYVKLLMQFLCHRTEDEDN